MTNAEYLAWLEDPNAPRLMITEAVTLSGGSATTRRMSKLGYTGGPGETPANAYYPPILRTGVEVTEELSIKGEANVAVGDLEVVNTAGQNEALLAEQWTNRSIECFMGHPQWLRADFKRFFRGVSGGIVRKDDSTLAIKLRDLMQRLNSPMHEVKLGTTAGANAEAIRPLCFGEVFNISPVLIDTGLLKYMVHDGPIEDIIEVRAGGLPVGFTKNLAEGTFTLTASPVGAVTADVQGDKFGTVYRNTIGALVERIVTGYGKASTRMTLSDLDTANFTAFKTSFTQAVGIYVKERTNVINVLRDLTKSIGAQVVPSTLGLLRLVQFALPAAGTPYAVTEKHMVEGTFVPVGDESPVGAVKIAYAKNWTPQDSVLGGVPSEHAEMYKSDWDFSTPADDIAIDKYLLDRDPVAQETMLIDDAEALAEAQRRLQIWKQPRTIYEFTAYPELTQLELGAPITVTHRKYNMAGGVQATVIGRTVNPDNFHVKLKIIV